MQRSGRGAGATASRFYRMEELGAGANGVVYRALDLTLGAEVALKYLARPAGRDLYRFKREFRALAEVAHPNLVQLHELFVEGEQWCFTMELVAGVPLREHLRRAPDTLAATFTQLADGVAAIHALGKIHRDLKPTNVLVEPGGRVVVLDFGLVRGVDPEELDHTHEAMAVGTPAFMSPEQAQDLPLTAATDWYAVGAMLYEALTGRRPFDGTALDVMRRRVHEDPPRPRAVRADVPAALDELCMALLERDPARRAGAAELFAAFGASPSAATVALSRRQLERAPFVGRTRELAAMRAALAEAEAGACVFMPVIGPSGMGKSTLIRELVDGLDPARVLVVEGRCHEREHLPYQGIESLVDVAATMLLARADDELERGLAADVASLARLFPALLRVPMVAAAAGRRRGATDPAELRRRAVAALGDLLGFLAGPRTPVVVLDDLQWSDADGGAVLADLVRYFADSGALFIAGSRGAIEVPTGPGHGPRDATPTAQLDHPTQPVGPLVTIRELELGPLELAEVAELARTVAPGRAWTDDDAGALVRASGGVPLFVAELAGQPGSTGDAVDAASAAASLGDAGSALGRVLGARVAALPAEARALLATCAAATRPLPIDVAAAAAAGDAASALSLLRGARLVRSHRHGDQLLIEPYHDAVRGAVMAALEPGERRAVHRKLATALEGRPGAAATDLVEHWLAAGVPERAAVHAAAAARHAEDALAFHVAAELYGTALASPGALPPDAVRDLRRRRVSCLADVGRLDDAIAALDELAADADDRERLAVDSLRVEYLLRAGQVERGVGESRALCARLGVALPHGPRAQLRAILWASLVMRLRRPRPRLCAAADAEPAELERIDALWSISSGLAYSDPKLGRLLQLHHLRAALACGERTRLARALCVEIPYVAQAGSRAGRRLDEARAAARALVDQTERPDIQAVFHASCGVGAAVAGDWLAADQACRAAEQLLREHYGGIRWVLNMTQFYRVLAAWYLGRTDELVRLVPAYLADAEAVGDVHALAGLRFGRGSPYWLVTDRPEEGRALAVHGWRREAGGDFRLQEYFQALAEAQCALYQGQPEQALDRLAESQPRFERSLVRRIQIVRIEWAHVTARAALGAAATRRGRDRDAAGAIARAAMRKVAAERAPWAAPLEALSEAALAHQAGDEAAAVAALERAVATAGERAMALHAAVARHRLGETRGAAGRAMVDEAAAWMRARAIVDPAAIVRLIAPGWASAGSGDVSGPRTGT
ncbi:MAG: protein kinase [Myxococcales bacterium]|nr:protein kinase [Myxococcales bacterium]